MGNQQDRDCLLSTNEPNDEQQWTTVETLTKSQVSPNEQNTKSYFRKMTQLEPLAQPKRWSESRKVQNSQTDLTMMTKKSSKLKHYTRTLINIYEDKAPTPQSQKLNSTVCKGGNILSKSMIDGFSPIKKKILRTTSHKPTQSLKQNLRNKVVPVTTSSITSLEKQITSQDKVKKWLMTSPVNLPDGNNKSSSEIPVKEKERVTSKGNHSDQSRSYSSEISPIPSEFCFPEYDENKNLTTEIVLSKMKTKTQDGVKQKVNNNNNSTGGGRPKRLMRKKRKRICMPANWRGKQSPQEKVCKNNKNIVDGKEMSKICSKIHKGIKVKVNEDGNITFDKCPYKLRSRSSVMLRNSERVEKTDREQMKKVEYVDDENSNKKEANLPKGVAVGKEADSSRALGGFVVFKGNSLGRKINEEINEREENEEENEEESEEGVQSLNVGEKKGKDESSLLINDESPPNMDIANMAHSKRKLNFAPKRLLANIKAAENENNNSLTNNDVIKDGIPFVEKSSIDEVFEHSRKIPESLDKSERSTCVLQRTCSDSGFKLSSFACDSKSCVSDFLQASL